MAELDLVEERLISGTGLLRVPGLVEQARYFRLNIDVIREVPEPFKSFKWEPSRSRYCTLAFMRDGYVIEEQPVDYERRQFEWLADSPGQTLIAVKCSYKGILQTFVNLGIALNITPISVTNLIEDYENLRLLWDEVRVVCEGSTAVQVRLFVLRYDDDCESSDERELPPPPPPLPRIPPGTGIGSISPPYEDDDVTSPNSLDEDVPPEDIGSDCQTLILNFSLVFADNTTENGSFPIKGVYRPSTEQLSNNGSVVNGLLRAEFQGYDTCGALQLRNIVGRAKTIASWSVTITFP